MSTPEPQNTPNEKKQAEVAGTDGGGTKPWWPLTGLTALVGALFGGVTGGIKRIWPGALTVGVIALIIAAIQGQPMQWPDQIKKVLMAGHAALSEPALPGVLSIEPPQLYTRERLVNDRFRQANWLEQQLAKTKIDQPTGPVSRETRSQSLQGFFNGPQQTAAADGTPQSAQRAPVETSALQQLSAVDKMRLRLRTDLMDTLLDDGHDLEGNTLYRLNFDAVVMPLISRRSYPGTAVFIIEARDPYSPSDLNCPVPADMETCNARRVAQEQNRILDDVELLRGWQREIQQFLTKVLEARIEAFRQDGRLHNPVDPKENIALDWFLRRELFSSFLGAVVYDPDVLALCREQGLVRADMRRADSLSPGWAAACKNWISETVGFAWRQDKPVPTVKASHALAPMVQSGFRKAIRRAHYINTVLAIEGQMTLQRLQQGTRRPEPQNPAKTNRTLWQADAAYCAYGPQKPGQGDCGPPEASTPQAPMSVSSMPQDEDYKRALVRLISVWRGMEQWGHDAQLGAMMHAAFTGQEQKVSADPAADQRKVSPEFRLLAILNKFDTNLPSEEDIADLRDRLRREGARNFVMVRDQPMAHPQLRSTLEHCGRGPDLQSPPPVAQVYKCMMTRGEAAYASNELLSHFLLARLQEELDVYDRESRSIRDFLDISLEGCSTTGCRIQVSQHSDLPGNEVFGAREAGFLPVVNKLGRRSQSEATPATLLDVIGGFKSADGGLFGGANWQTYLNANCLAKNLSLRSIRLTDEGLKAATLIVDRNLSQSDAPDACAKRQFSYESRKRLETTKSCLGLAGRHADNHEARTEVYLSCMLRDWINTQRSDVTVYAVSPRAGDGDDLTHRIEETAAQLGATAPAGSPISGQMRFADAKSREEVISNPRVIGFSHLPGSNKQDMSGGQTFTDRATFGWAIRPRRLSATGGYQSSHHRLSAVISLPSWWKRVKFDVRACWVQPPQVASPTVDFTKLCGATTSVGAETPGADAEIMPSMRQFRRHFEIKLPRRVEEVTSRFNFDFIRAPYYYREFDQYVRRYPQILSLEAGRSGKLVLQGERLWRGTVVTVNNQSADSIVVLPDMKGVVAHFNCVHPPDGMFHFMSYEDNLDQARAAQQASAGGPPNASGPPPGGSPGNVPRAPLFVWTSEGGTTDKDVAIHPFVQRWKDEKPCWLDNPDR